MIEGTAFKGKLPDISHDFKTGSFFLSNGSTVLVLFDKSLETKSSYMFIFPISKFCAHSALALHKFTM